MPVGVLQVIMKVSERSFHNQQSSNLVTGLILAGTAMIAGAAVIQFTGTAIDFAWFDVDPASVDHPAFGLLPSIRLFLDVVMLFGAGLILLMMMLRRQPISWSILLLAFMPVPIILWHGWNDPADFEQGSVWIASIIGAVALCHAARHHHVRCLALAVLMGGLAPLVVCSLGQIFWEIPATIAYFESNPAEVLAMRGFEPGSSAALVLERRLLNAVPTAWFDSTNLLSSLMAAGSCFWLSITFDGVRNKLSSGVVGLCGVVAIVLAAMVFATGSIGGLAVLLIGVVFLSMYRMLPLAPTMFGWLGDALVMRALIAAPLASLFDGLPGIDSLLIRNGYVAGAADVTASAPLVGVGPSEFQTAWMSVRGAGSPEEIVSPHSMPWDWLATIGVLSIGWIVLVLIAVWWSLRRSDQVDQGSGTVHVSWGLFASSLIVMASFLLFQFNQFTILGPDLILLRIIGWLSFISMTAWLIWLWRRVPNGVMTGAAVAALVLVVHAQVEMTIQQSSTVPWILCMVGLAGCMPTSRRVERSGWLAGMVGGLLAVGLATIVIVIGLIPTLFSERVVEAAGRMVRETSLSGTGASLLSGRTVAGRMLLESGLERGDRRLQLVAAQQMFAGIPMAHSLPSPPSDDSVDTVLAFVMDVSMNLFEEYDSIEAGHLALAAMLTREDSSTLQRAVVLAERIARRDPSGLWSQRHLADALWNSGERDLAGITYRRVLQLDDARAIDPLRRLSQEDRALIESRVE